MNKKKYLIYFDILGFEKLAEIIGREKGIETREVRDRFIHIIKERIAEIEKEFGIAGKKWGHSDDWLIATNSINNLLRSIYSILEIKTPYEGYEKIPLEIALGAAKYDKWAKFDEKDLIIEDDTIKFLKTNIIGHYHKWHKNQKFTSIKSTFIVLTEAVYKELEPFDKKYCIYFKCAKGSNKKDYISFYTADPERIKKRGKLFQFLEKIGHSESKWYGRIDDIYVSPIEYQEIKSTLAYKRIVFITGTPEYGKTYTAVRIMWEYFNKGVEPKWITGGELGERIDVRKRLENIEAELRPNHIIYFEDPFGKTKYEKREALEREIGTIVDTVTRVDNSFVIITAREEIFKEFERSRISAKDLKEFEYSLNIKRPSYDNKKRIEILLKWSEEKKCRWLESDHLRNMVIFYVEWQNALPTPLSIRIFTIATAHIESETLIAEELRIKSKETAKVFADEVKNMTYDKVLFLLFIFIHKFDIHFIKSTYDELVGEMNLGCSWDFDRILGWFKNDKVNIVDYYGDKYLEFSHPSYSEALPHVLIEDGYITEINRTIFSRLLSILSERYKAPAIAAQALFENIEMLDKDLRDELLLKLSKDGESAWFVARKTISYLKDHKEIPKDWIRIIFKLCETERVAALISLEIAKNYESLPDFFTNDVILKLSKNRVAIKGVVRAITENYLKLPDKIRKLLHLLSEQDEAVGYVAASIVRNFDKLPNDIVKQLTFLSCKSEAAEKLSIALHDNFNKIPQDLRNRLLYNLSESKNGVGRVATILFNYFDKFDNISRNDLLLRLSDNENALGAVARTITYHYKKLPEKICALLPQLIEKGKSIKPISRAIRFYFEYLPVNVRNSLIADLSENEEATGNVTFTIITNYENIPADIIMLSLHNIIVKNKAAKIVAICIERQFEYVPEKLKDTLFNMLSEQNESAEIIASIVIRNFNRISKRIRHRTLDRLSKMNESAEQVKLFIKDNYKNLPKYLQNTMEN